jgi:hypothetical protein
MNMILLHMFFHDWYAINFVISNESLWHLVGKARTLRSTISLWQTMHHITWLYMESIRWLLFTLKNAQVAKII